jgi:hypothetical protein
MLVKDLSTSSSIGRSDVVLPKLHHILLNCHRDYCSLPFISSEATKTNMGCSCQTNNKHVFGVGKGKWWMLEGDISSVDKNLVNL